LALPPARAAQRPEFDDPLEQGTTDEKYLTRIHHHAVSPSRLNFNSETVGQTQRQEALLEERIDVSLDVKVAAKSFHRFV